MSFRSYHAIILTSISLVLSSCKGDIAGSSPPGPPWIIYNEANSPLAGNQINAITVDREGRVWFATDSGASSFTPHTKSWAFIRDSLGFEVAGRTIYSVTAIAEGRDQSLWFGLRGGGVVRYNERSEIGKIWSRFRSQIASDYIASIAADISPQTTYGEVWVASYLGVNKWHQLNADDGTWEDLTSILPIQYVHASAVNPFDGRIWLGGGSGNVAELYYDIGLRWNVLNDPALVSTVNGIAFDGANNVWFAKEIGITKVNMISGSLVHPVIPGGGAMPAGEIHAVETDLHLLRWFGTDSGLVALSDTTWFKINASNSPLPNNIVTAIKYDRSGNLWIGTRNGAAVYNPGGTRF